MLLSDLAPSALSPVPAALGVAITAAATCVAIAVPPDPKTHPEPSLVR